MQRRNAHLQLLLVAVALSCIVQLAFARTLKDAPLDIKFPGGSVKGGNGKPLVVEYPTGKTVVDKKDEGKGADVAVKYPGGNTQVKAGDKTQGQGTTVASTYPGGATTAKGGENQPTTVDVKAPGTTTTVKTGDQPGGTKVDVKAPGSTTNVDVKPPSSG